MLEWIKKLFKRNEVYLKIEGDPYVNIPSGVELRTAGNPGSSGQVLTSQGAGNNPIWADPPTGATAEEVWTYPDRRLTEIVSFKIAKGLDATPTKTNSSSWAEVARCTFPTFKLPREVQTLRFRIRFRPYVHDTADAVSYKLYIHGRYVVYDGGTAIYTRGDVNYDAGSITTSTCTNRYAPWQNDEVLVRLTSPKSEISSLVVVFQVYVDYPDYAEGSVEVSYVEVIVN